MGIRLYFAISVSLFLLICFSAFLSGGELAKLRSINTKQNKEISAHEDRIKALEFIINEVSSITVKATAYNAVPEQTDNEPDVNACRKPPRIGRIAVSQDLFYKGWTCGKWVAIQGLGIFQIDDVMHKRKTNQVDIIKETVPQAVNFGVVNNLNAVLLSNYEQI